MRHRGAAPSSCDHGRDSSAERTANAFVARASMPKIVLVRNAYLPPDELTGALSCVSPWHRDAVKTLKMIFRITISSIHVTVIIVDKNTKAKA